MINKVAVNLFVFFVSTYILTASITNLCNTDAGRLRLEVVKSIVERFDVSVPEGSGITGIDGREYSWVGIGSAILAIPFYITAKFAGFPPENAISIMNLLAGAAAAVTVFLFSISLGYSRRSSVLVSIFYGLGTMAWPIAKQPFDNTIETFFVLSSAYFMHLYAGNKKMRYLLLSSVTLGFAFITRPTSLLAVPPLIFIAAPYLGKMDFKRTLKSLTSEIGLFLISFLPFVVLSLCYNYYRFGSAFETGYSLMATRLGVDLFTGTPLLTGLYGFIFSPGKGFFYYSPAALLFFFSIGLFVRRHRCVSAGFILLTVLYLLFLSRNIYWHGDWAWGPRYLHVITPFLIIPVAGLLDSGLWEKVFTRIAVFSIFAIGFIIQLAAVSVDFQKYFISLQLEENIRFEMVSGQGVQSIAEPPRDNYFQWERSPIVRQIRYVYEMPDSMKKYKYSEFRPAPQANMKYNVFDFWWLFALYAGAPVYIIVPLLTSLGLILVISMVRVARMVKE